MKTDPQLIKKAILVNSFLVLYYCCSNLSSFFGIVLGVSMLSTAGVLGFLSNKSKGNSGPNEQVFSVDFVQKKYNQFLTSSLSKQITTLIGLYIITKVSWYIPSWLLLLVIGESYVFWEVLKQNAVFDKVHSNVQLARQSIEKSINLIPKYQPNE